MLKYIIIDDEPLAHEIIEEYCSMLPHLQLEKNCYSAMEAMQYLNKSTVDFIFLDINMPIMDGFEFLEKRKSSNLCRNSSIIILTSSGRPSDQKRAFEFHNVIDYIEKPLNYEKINHTLLKLRDEASNL